MSLPTDSLAIKPAPTQNAPSVLIHACQGRNGGCSIPSSNGALITRQLAAVSTNFCSRDAKSAFGALGSLPSRIPPSTRGHASGPYRRPAARRRSALTTSPFQGLGSSQNKFESCGKQRRSNFFRAPPRKHSLALGSRAHSLGFA